MGSRWLILIKSVGKAHYTNIDLIEPTMAVKSDTKIISICIPQRTTQFQWQDNGKIGLFCSNPQKSWPQGFVGTPIYQWVVPGNIHQTLFMIQWRNKETSAKRVSDTVYFDNTYIADPTLTPDDAFTKSAQQLTAVLKVKLKIDIEKIGINQLNKPDAIFNTTAHKLRQEKIKLNPNTRQNNPTPAMRM